MHDVRTRKNVCAIFSWSYSLVSNLCCLLFLRVTAYRNTATQKIVFKCPDHGQVENFTWSFRLVIEDQHGDAAVIAVEGKQAVSLIVLISTLILRFFIFIVLIFSLNIICSD